MKDLQQIHIIHYKSSGSNIVNGNPIFSTGRKFCFCDGRKIRVNTAQKCINRLVSIKSTEKDFTKIFNLPLEL